MPSVEPTPLPPPTPSVGWPLHAGPSRWAWLRSQGLGLVCGLCTAALLGVGSFVLSFGDDGGGPFVRMDDVRVFFERPMLRYWWFYALLPVLALYALNTLLATWESVTRRWRAGVRAPSAFGAAVLHLAFLAALAAHGLDGLWHVEEGRLTVGPEFVRLPDGDEARLVSLRTERLPGGMPKTVHALVELRDAAGRLSRTNVGFNEPLSFGFGSRVWLYQGQGRTYDGQPVIALEGRRKPGHPWALVACALLLVGLALLWRRLLPQGRPAPPHGSEAQGS